MPKGTLSVAGSLDMLAEPLLPKLLLFSFPLMVSSVLQLLFNAADVIVVGRCASYMSLAAVGSTTVIVNLVVNLLVGLAVGVNVVIAHYLGEGGRDAEISAVLHTAIALALAGGIVLGGIGYVLSGWMLRITNVQEDIFPLALSYLQIYFIGTPSIVLYNYGAAALRAKGDTRLPLVFLTISGVVNVVLNLLFVIVLQLDVVGVALATVISETLSAVLILTSFIRAKDGLAFSWNKIRIDRRSLILLAKIGIPAGAQGCMFSLANTECNQCLWRHCSGWVQCCQQYRGLYLCIDECVSPCSPDVLQPEYRGRTVQPGAENSEKMHPLRCSDGCCAVLLCSGAGHTTPKNLQSGSQCGSGWYRTVIHCGGIVCGVWNC